MGPQVFLRMPVLKKDKSVRIEFMAFGGGWVDQTLKKAMEATPHTGRLPLATTQPLNAMGWRTIRSAKQQPLDPGHRYYATVNLLSADP
jgi:hypothetical protein